MTGCAGTLLRKNGVFGRSLTGSLEIDMYVRLAAVLSAVLLPQSLIYAAEAPPPPAPAPTQATPEQTDKIKKLIQQLNAPDNTQREDAERDLLAVGQPAL